MSEAPSGHQAGKPNLDFLKKSAKDLKRALQRGEPQARARFAAVFTTVFAADREAAETLANCLHVIAREQGYQSWPQLKLDVALRRADTDALAARLGGALYYGRLIQAERILALRPDIAEGRFALQVALFDEAAVTAALDADPGRLFRAEKIIPDSRVALDAFSRLGTSHYARLRPDLAEAQMRLGRMMLERGADANVQHGWPEDPSQKLSILYGALCAAGNLPFGAMLLEAGADPNDNECAYHACEQETLDAMRLLLDHGVTFPGTNALLRMLDFDKYEGAELLLANGADPNERPVPFDRDAWHRHDNALHHAIRRGRDGRFADLLIAHGADPQATSNGRSYYALAAICGNEAMRTTLRDRGLATGLSPSDALLAAAASGNRGEALRLWAEDKDAVSRLSDADQRLPIEFAAQRGRLAALEAMQAVGFDPDLTNAEDMTALHVAAWFGHADYVRFYLTLDPDKTLRNAYGATALGNAVHGSENCPERASGDYVETAQALVEAGYTIEPEHGHLDMGSEAVTALLEERLEQT